MSNFNIAEASKQEPCFDSTLIKIFLNSVKDGDLQQIKNHIEKYHFDVTIIKDVQLEQNPIFYATSIKDDNEAFKIMEYFVNLGVNPKAKDKLMQTPIYYTARDGKYKCTEYLINCGTPINEKDFYLQTPIYYAARENQIEIVKLLLGHNSNINEEDKYGQTPIFYAIKEGHYEVVKLLIDEGADVNKIDKKKHTPYTYALKFNQSQIAQMLLSRGAQDVEKPEVKDKKGKNKTKKSTGAGNVNESLNTSNLNEEENEALKPKKFVLVKVTSDGQKRALTQEEIELFKSQYRQVAELIYNEKKLEELEKEVPDQLKSSYDSWEKVAKKLMNTLCKMRDSEIFHRPVDPVSLGIPDYFDIIKNPMDFSTIKKKLTNSTYTNCQEFVNDLELVFSNCYRYNGENTLIGNICTKVREEYLKLSNQVDLKQFL